MSSNGERKRGRETDDAEEGASAFPAKTPKQNGKKKATTPQSINVDELKRKWTPERTDRSGNGITKMSSKPERPLCGGDWICSSDGTAATLSFVFYKEKKYFGLTVAHIFDDAPNHDVFTFMKRSEAHLADSLDGPKEEEFDPAADSESFAAYKIGSIVSWSASTDSVVFELDGNIDLEEPLTVKVASDSTRVLKLPNIESGVTTIPPPEVGSTLVGFGASHRGFHAVVEISSTDSAHKLAYVPNDRICIKSHVNNERITFHGDCGAIFLDLGCNGVYFRTDGTLALPWKSFGVPLVEVIRNHSLLGGTNETSLSEGNRQIDRNEEDRHVQQGDTRESIVPILGAKFKMHIVPAPDRKTERRGFKIANFKTIPPLHSKESKMT